MTARTSAQRLLRSVSKLRAVVHAEASATLRRWEPALTRKEFRPAAANLAYYLALRRRDIRSIQEDLSELGLSSLGRSEARVLPALDAVLATLRVLAGGSEGPRPLTGTQRAGQAAIAREQVRIFGPDPHGPGTRIMMTMPSEAATDRALVRRMIAAGADCARINCAHDGPEVWRAIAANVRAAARAQGRACTIFMDLAGPKIRITDVRPSGKVRLRRGDQFVLTRTAERPHRTRIEACISHEEILQKLTPGSTVWIDDGKIGARTVRVWRTHALLEVVSARDHGQRLRPEKGINLPSTELEIPPLTRKDLVDLDFVAAHADCVGYSFVQRPADVVELQRQLAVRRSGRRPMPLVLKIETSLAVRNLPRLIVAAGGRQPVAVMIARGDLAVEIGFSRLSEIQEQMLWICEAAHVPVIWATEVLASLVKNGIARRGEATDAAMAQRAECVMLNKGPHQIEAIRFLDEVLRRMDRHQHKKSPRLGPLESWSDRQTLDMAE